eukprot:CAMPEP_0185772188 /NCGR_PEP_ID=MMETSP1174-20130828/67526_1 /TAXON_ID=35687 /ORGANISM="Dictyocha speculum, Strain CCMP1381" /LENGTH=48 /DNA_ID= /DNA_START= /DNA_END= /DNA_ORIENTATION=
MSSSDYGGILAAIEGDDVGAFKSLISKIDIEARVKTYYGRRGTWYYGT